MSLLRKSSNIYFCSLRFIASPHADHYAVLGVEPSASSKEIKAAYYNLSKQYHPDINPDGKEASKKFHEVAQAYEVLGSDEQRKIYDMTRIRTAPDLGRDRLRQHSRPQRQYTDTDIDYKSFEHFQRNTRRRKQYHSHYDMPHEFYSEFGGKKRVYKSEYEESTEKIHSMYKDSRAMQREEEELRRDVERKMAEQQAKYPIPTFEQMLREKREKEAHEQRRYIGCFIAFASSGVALYLLIR